MSARESGERAVLPNGAEPIVALPHIIQVARGTDIPFGIFEDQVGVALQHTQARGVSLAAGDRGQHFQHPDQYGCAARRVLSDQLKIELTRPP